MGILNGVTDTVLNNIKYYTIGDILKSTSRGTKPINNPFSASTITKGENSLLKNLFKSSSDKEAWYKMKMGGKDGEEEWRLSGARVASAFVGASALGRLATGGGIYKDADGNTDIIGIPFI